MARKGRRSQWWLLLIPMIGPMLTIKCLAQGVAAGADAAALACRRPPPSGVAWRTRARREWLAPLLTGAPPAAAFAAVYWAWAALRLPPGGPVARPVVALLVAGTASCLVFLPWGVVVTLSHLGLTYSAEQRERETAQDALTATARRIGALTGKPVHAKLGGSRQNGELHYSLDVAAVRPGTVEQVVRAQLDAVADAGYTARPWPAGQDGAGQDVGLGVEAWAVGRGCVFTPPDGLPAVSLRVVRPGQRFPYHSYLLVPDGQAGVYLVIGGTGPQQ